MRLMLDPGHTGQTDPGAAAGGIREADVTLDVALRVAARLRGAAGIEVRLTRVSHGDLAVPYTQKDDLQARCDRANAWPADLFLSIHCNAATNPAAYGLETYIHTDAPQRTTEIGHSLHATLAPLARADRGLKRANFYVLRETQMPAMLVELGFLTNTEDCRLLTDPQWQARLADAIAGWVRQRWGSPAPAPAGPAGTPILGPARATAEQARTYLHEVAPGWEEIAELTWEVASAYGVRPEVALALMLHETGRFRFGADVQPEQNNFGGIGATGGGARGASFPSRRVGVEAVVQHLYAYASTEPLPAGVEQIDPRFHLVRRGSATTLEALGGKWAVPGYDPARFRSFDAAFAAGQTYGQVIRDRYLAPLLSTTPWPAQQPEPSPPSPPVSAPWDPAAEIRRLRERGVINTDHDPAATPTWGEMATIINRVLDRIK